MKNTEKVTVENNIKVLFEIRESKKIIPNRKTIQISVNGTTLIRVLPTKEIEEILILENENNNGWKKRPLKEGMEIPLVSSPERVDEFGICYDTETNEIRVFGTGREVKLQTPADWVIKFKSPGSWMNNQIWLNPRFK